MVSTWYEKMMLEKILVSEKQLSDINFERLGKVLTYRKNNIIDSYNMYLTVDSLININNIITCLNNITLRKANDKPYGYEKI